MRLSFSLICLCLAFSLSAQLVSGALTEKTSCVTVGILQGGGSLLGADFETLINNKLGVQLGAGIIGYGAGINYHLSNSIQSSFISLQYWNQGVGNTHTQSLLGPNFVYRGKSWFTAQIGLGFALDKGPGYPANRVQPPAMLMYAIGAYFPI